MYEPLLSIVSRKRFLTVLSVLSLGLFVLMQLLLRTQLAGVSGLGSPPVRLTVASTTRRASSSPSSNVAAFVPRAAALAGAATAVKWVFAALSVLLILAGAIVSFLRREAR